MITDFLIYIHIYRNICNLSINLLTNKLIDIVSNVDIHQFLADFTFVILDSPFSKDK